MLREVRACNGCHLGKLRTLTQDHLKLCEGLHGSLGHAFNGAILKIRDESSDIESVRMVKSKAAKADALHAAFDDVVDSFQE